MEKHTILQLPENNQKVKIRLRKYNNLKLDAVFIASEQIFVIFESGLRVNAIEVLTWE